MRIEKSGSGKIKYNHHGKHKISRVIAEEVLGKRLQKGAVVHHIDCNGLNDRPSNLVICQDDTCHKLLHRRMRAHAATGNPEARICYVCKQWDTFDNPNFILIKRSDRPAGDGSPRHRSCHTKREAQRSETLIKSFIGRVLCSPHVLCNLNGSLIICEDKAYVNFLYKRTRALEACGHADWRKCAICGEWDSPENPDLKIYYLKSRPNDSGRAMHLSCSRRYMKNRRKDL